MSNEEAEKPWILKSFDIPFPIQPSGSILPTATRKQNIGNTPFPPHSKYSPLWAKKHPALTYSQSKAPLMLKTKPDIISHIYSSTKHQKGANVSTMHLAINGAGRIGRLIARAYFAYPKLYPSLTLRAINDPHDPKALVHLLTYDSTHGRFQGPITLENNSTMTMHSTPIHLSQSRDPKCLPWQELGIDVVFECTGKLKTRALAAGHLEAGARQVILSCPSPDADATVVLGANDHNLSLQTPVLSIGSCTTNALAPLLACVDRHNPIKHGFMTTIHAYTSDQALLDRHHSDLRRARSAQFSIIPTKTGAANAIGQVLKHLDGKLQGYALRVPTANVSALEVQLTLENAIDREKLIEHLINSAKQSPVLDITTEPLVSIDFNQNPASCIIDLSYLQCTDNTVKILAWYDNEWAYAARMLDTAQRLYQLQHAPNPQHDLIHASH